MESVLEIIAGPNRRAVLSLLASSQHSLDLSDRELAILQPEVSKRLCVLRESGFVESMVGLYRLKSKPLLKVDAWLAQFRRFWSARIDALERHLDRLHSSKPTKNKAKEKTSRTKPRT